MSQTGGPPLPAAPTIGALLERRALLNRRMPALVADGRTLSFGQLHAWAVAVERVLTEANVATGDRVAVLSRNSAASIALYYGAARRGAILCNLNIRLSAEELSAIVADCEPALLVAQPEFADLAATLAARHGVPAPWTFGDAPFPSPPARGSDDPPLDAITAVAAGGVRNSIASDAPLLLVYTSGTTGRPKGALLSHAGLYWAAATVAGALDYRQGDVSLIPVPLFHVGGMSYATLFAYLGATAVVPSGWEPGAILRSIESDRVNHFFAVATMLRSLLDHPNFASTDLSSLRFLVAGGAPVPADLIEAFAAHGLPLLQSYGSTETAGPATVVDPPNHLLKASSAGLPFLYTDLRIVGEDGRILPADGTGEIQVRAPHLISGYWRDPAATSEAFEDGWYRTGDIGCLDADGYLYVKARKKDVIISGGENVFPDEVEAVLMQHPAIAEVGVAAKQDPNWGEVPCAWIVLRNGAKGLDQSDLQAFCSDKLARYKIPKAIEISAEPLPRNATGKLLRHRLQSGRSS